MKIKLCEIFFQNTVYIPICGIYENCFRETLNSNDAIREHCAPQKFGAIRYYQAVIRVI